MGKEDDDEVADGVTTLKEIIEDTKKELDDLKSEIDRLTHAGEYDKISALALDVTKLEAFLESQTNLLSMMQKAQEKLSAGDLQQVQSLVGQMLDLKCLAEIQVQSHDLEQEVLQEEQLGHIGKATEIMQKINDLHDKCEEVSKERVSEQAVLPN